MRTPETFYFNHGYVRFKKLDGQVHYEIWQYTGDGMMSMIVQNGKVKDEQHLKELRSLGNVTT